MSPLTIDRLVSGGVITNCDLCTDIREFLVDQAGDRFPELAPEGFYP